VLFFSQLLTYESEEEDDQDDNLKCSKEQLLDRIKVLTAENKRPRGDNARLRALRAVNEGTY
jgi:hypothetical protein